ncbi:D-xylose 1-dehydrogenase Gfo6 [Haloarchaeobius sp. FL176]|uniref:D-xylose 1-dehydrogenase Gfo6 n=1 Tax=Haloarchaeobius sp. FL176 TaxID=2967129 RepID=UPI00214987E6|nr:D-xylose 1-dehydrogenase Gfo6 [Haloarchaeobius sp. FL176]
MEFDGYLGTDDRDWETTADGTLRVAIVGLGWWSRERVLPALADLENCAATVGVSGSSAKREQVVADWPSVEHGLSYDEFAAGEAVGAYDAVYVCTPNALHLPHVETAAEFGKAVLCEKPMEASVERAERLVAACQAEDVPLMVGYRMQTDRAARAVRRLVREGVVGDPVTVHAHMSQPIAEMFDDPSHWRLDPDLAGAGASVTDLGVYPINTSRFVLDADPEAVTASTWSSESEWFERVPDERASFQLAFPDGVTALCSVSQNAYKTAEFRVVGTAGEVRMRPGFFGAQENELLLSTPVGETSVTYEPADQMRELFCFFADRVLAGKTIPADGQHGLVDMHVVEAVYDAAEDETRRKL